MRLVYAGVGGAIEIGIDALIEGRRVIYVGSNATRITLSISPVLHGGQRCVDVGAAEEVILSERVGSTGAESVRFRTNQRRLRVESPRSVIIGDIIL
jgi:hypothetical protein